MCGTSTTRNFRSRADLHQSPPSLSLPDDEEMAAPAASRARHIWRLSAPHHDRASSRPLARPFALRRERSRSVFLSDRRPLPKPLGLWQILRKSGWVGRGAGGGAVTVRHPAAFSLRAARKIPQTLEVTIPGAHSRTRPRGRRSPPPAPTFSTATRARSCARSSNTMSPTCARARALAGRPTRAQSHSQDRRRETPIHRAHKRAISRRHEQKERKRSARPRFFGARSVPTHGRNEPWPAHARKTKTQRAASERKT